LKQGISPSGVYVERPDFDSAVAQNNLSRSATAPAASPSRADDSPRPAGLERSKTTLNVPANARELTSGQGQSPVSARPNSDTTPARSNTTINVKQAPGIGAPVRGLSVRRPTASPTAVASAPPAPPAKDPENRLTEFYDDYLDSYADSNQPPLPPIRSGGAPAAPPDRVAAWARSNANPSYAPSRSGSRSAPASNYAPSSFGGTGGGGGTLRRKVTRRNTGRTTARVQSTYEEEEEGYASGDYEDAPFELIKIRVKLHYQDDVRGMTLTPDMLFDEFMEKVTTKFDKSLNGLGLKFKDEDGGKVTLRDESDYELAIETARESSKGKPEGKLEIWCMDL